MTALRDRIERVASTAFTVLLERKRPRIGISALTWFCRECANGQMEGAWDAPEVTHPHALVVLTMHRIRGLPNSAPAAEYSAAADPLGPGARGA